MKCEHIGEDVTLYLGDCLEVLPTLEAGSVDLIATDPPYLDGDLSFMLDHFTAIQERIVLTPGKLESFNWIKKKSPSWEYCWRMSSKSMGGSACMHIGWEPILSYGMPLVPVGNDVLTYTQKIYQKLNGAHPWPKPLELFKKIISHWAREGDTILDPFMGSGTTGVAAIQTGRKFIGIEIDPQYYEIARKRIYEATLQPRLF